MSDEKCPACGASVIEDLEFTHAETRWECESWKFPSQKFHQSDLCRIRQRDALLADLFKFTKHGVTCDLARKQSAGDRRDWDECDRLENAKCTCGLSALGARYKEMQK